MNNSKEWFTMNFDTRKAVIVNADGLLDARIQASAIIGPETHANQIGVCPRARKAFDRFPNMTSGIVFDVPQR